MDINGNKNCLEGRQCPNCPNHDSFKIIALVDVTVEDNGTDGFTGDVEYDDNSTATCTKCGYAGKWKDFEIAWQKDAPSNGDSLNEP